MKTLTQIAITGLLISVAGTAQAQSSDPFYMHGAANMCFEQAERALAGAASVEVSTASCNIALDNRPLGNQQKIALLHNRGVIQAAQGYNDAAAESFELAIAKSDEVGPPHIAMARLAHQQGHFNRALELYDAILDANDSKALGQNNRDRLERNRELALESLEKRNVAHNTP